jgi:hypothetical protein
MTTLVLEGVFHEQCVAAIAVARAHELRAGPLSHTPPRARPRRPLPPEATHPVDPQGASSPSMSCVAHICTARSGRSAAKNRYLLLALERLAATGLRCRQGLEDRKKDTSALRLLKCVSAALRCRFSSLTRSASLV